MEPSSKRIKDNNDDQQQPRPPCQYAEKCFRKNPTHFAGFSHPGDADYPTSTVKATTAPVTTMTTTTTTPTTSTTSTTIMPTTPATPTTRKGRVQIVNGNLLDAKEQLIAHQVNSKSRGVCFGIAKTIFKRFPEADVYKARTSDGIPGTTVIKANVASIVGQLDRGKPKRAIDSSEMREKWFLQALNDFGRQTQLKNISSVAFPYLVGCGLAGGHWPTYQKMLEDFAVRYSVDVTIYRLGDGGSGDE